MNREEVVSYFIKKGILVGPEIFDKLDSDIQSAESLDSFVFKNKEIFSLEDKDFDIIPSSDFIKEEKSNGFEETLQIQKQVDEDEKLESKDTEGVKIKFSYNYKNKKKEVADFVNYFKNRYESLKKILLCRTELQESISIARVARKLEGEKVSLIGIISDKTVTKNGNFKLVLEDPTGTYPILITKHKDEVYQLAKDLVLDEVIGLTGTIGQKIIFCNNLFCPDIPVNHELKKSPDEIYAVFISDIHFGIKNFLSSEFMKFVLWLKGEYGNDNQRSIANKVKYLFITGDVIEGVGIYPGQEEDLEIKDVYMQYEEATKYLKMIPEKIKIIICGGNHDAMRMSEPQPPFDRSYSKSLYEMPNAVFVSNPASVNIHASEGFPGFDVLMYHGGSFPYFSDAVSSIREKGGFSRCDLIMKFLLQRRHLAPSHSSTLYVPDETMDPLVIEKVPDIFVSGHIHQITVGSYRNVSLINSSCWVVQSEDNAKRGIVPHPAKIPIMNLKTREIKIMNFLDDDAKILYSERLGLK